MKIVKTIQMACGQAYVVETNGGLLEMGDVYLPNENHYGTRPYRFSDFGDVSDANKRVMTICTMLGCCGNCAFCSVRRTFRKKLSADEIVAQIDFLLAQGAKLGRSESPLESKEFHVLYSRMGEPSLNIHNVLSSIDTLGRRYPHVRIGMSTIGWKNGVKQFLLNSGTAERLMLQFSAHGTDDDTRAKLLGVRPGSSIMTLADIADFCRSFRVMNPRKISLNFVLLQGERYDFCSLRKLFREEDIYIRLSPLNVTGRSDDLGLKGLLQEKDVLNKAPISSEELRKVIQNLEESGFAYAYAPAIDEEIRNQAACGQALEILRKEQMAHQETVQGPAAGSFAAAAQ